MATTKDPFGTMIEDPTKQQASLYAKATAAPAAAPTPTVQGNIDNIIAKDSPLMQRAATYANQQMNRRGLLNSSMAVGAAQNAVLDAALPIAQLDEGSRQFGLSYGLEKAKVDQNESQFGRNLGEQTRQFDIGEANRMKLGEMELANKSDISSSENISRAWGSMNESITQIQNNPELDAATKQTLIDNQLAGFRSYTAFWKKMSGGAVDVSDLLNFSTATAAGGPATPATPVPAAPPAASWNDPTYARN